MENIKGYVYTIFSGLLLLVGLIFVALQWGNDSSITAFGPEVKVRTIWLVLCSATAGILATFLVRLLVRGLRVLHKVRSERRRIAAQIDARSSSEKPAAKDTSAPGKNAENDNPLSPR